MSDVNAPANANEGCVGPSSESAGKASACEGCPNQGACSSGAFSSPEAIAAQQAQIQALQEGSLRNVQHVIMVLSGKGGVGKSTVASQLAHTLAAQGYAVGLLDVDLCGPSAPRMVLGSSATSCTISKSGSGAWTPVYAASNLAVVSISFLLQDPNQAVVWRGPRKNALIQQFMLDVDWTGDTDGLDYLIVDTPPGTSDEHISTVNFLTQAGAAAGALVVTTPEEVSLADVRKELNFCQKTKIPVLGVIENMADFVTPLDSLQFMGKDGVDCTAAILEELRVKCPQALECVVTSPLFGGTAIKTNSDTTTGTKTPGSVEQMAAIYQVPFWGSLPMDPRLLKACDQGEAFSETHPNEVAAQRLVAFAKTLCERLPVDMAGASKS
uniref:Cytosolic Fe-S cluster assembly factor NUBP1 homolog n=1 Tax=Amphora coffeiformis TaxID=265554 RepID=A0A7S3P5E1_9STRA|mmetsp:Transcript_19025/g.38421  ORF Transcript_19025/g.38421 Transcript_19025/m.38421 type:complete len:383 (+) Transcript_19025:76-1224(+)